MKITSISEKKLKTLKPLILEREVLNTEGELYLLNKNGEKKVFKKIFCINEEGYANKLYTISMLADNKDCFNENLCIPDSLVEVKNNIVGFTLPYIEGKNLKTILMDANVKPKDKLKYFIQIGKLLEKMEGMRKHTQVKDFYINDMHESNFMVDKNDNVHIIDLDSAKIGNNKTAVSMYLYTDGLLQNAKNKYVIEDYNYGIYKADRNTDLYCYNIMLLNLLYGNGDLSTASLEEYYKYLNYLEDIGINKEVVDSFYKLVINTMNVNPYLSLDSITNENICRANQIVYKKVVKN